MHSESISKKYNEYCVSLITIAGHKQKSYFALQISGRIVITCIPTNQLQ